MAARIFGIGFLGSGFGISGLGIGMELQDDVGAAV